MIRLIDADNFKEFLQKLQEAGAESVSFDDLHKFLDEQPTAYDLDKVVYDLEKRRDKYKKLYEECSLYSPCLCEYKTRYEECAKCLDIMIGEE